MAENTNLGNGITNKEDDTQGVQNERASTEIENEKIITMQDYNNMINIELSAYARKMYVFQTKVLDCQNKVPFCNTKLLFFLPFFSCFCFCVAFFGLLFENAVQCNSIVLAAANDGPLVMREVCLSVYLESFYVSQIRNPLLSWK